MCGAHAAFAWASLTCCSIRTILYTHYAYNLKQVVHYRAGESFGMHHDSSKFQPRQATAFYYLNDVTRGGETYFPAADGAVDLGTDFPRPPSPRCPER